MVRECFCSTSVDSRSKKEEMRLLGRKRERAKQNGFRNTHLPKTHASHGGEGAARGEGDGAGEGDTHADSQYESPLLLPVPTCSNVKHCSSRTDSLNLSTSTGTLQHDYYYLLIFILCCCFPFFLHSF